MVVAAFVCVPHLQVLQLQRYIRFILLLLLCTCTTVTTFPLLWRQRSHRRSSGGRCYDTTTWGGSRRDCWNTIHPFRPNIPIANKYYTYQPKNGIVTSSLVFASSPKNVEEQSVDTDTDLFVVRRTDDKRQEKDDETITSHSSLQQQQPNGSRTSSHRWEKDSYQQTIAIIGSGAVGCYYGSRLWEGGHNVQFYMRHENYDICRQQGLQVSSDVGSDVYIAPDELRVFNDIPTMRDSVRNETGADGYDWIIVSLKSTGLPSIPELIVPLFKSENTTRVLCIMNGMIENDLIRYIQEYVGETCHEHDTTTNKDIVPLQCCQTLYGGMALICSNRISPGQIHHSYFGLLSIGVASTRSTNDDNRDQLAIEQLFYKHVPSENHRIDVDIAYEHCLVRGRWKKMIWNLPFNGISVAMGGITVDEIVKDPHLRQLAYNIMDETILVANTELQLLNGTTNETTRMMLGDLEKNAMMKLSDDMGPYKPSTMLDFRNRRSMEVQYLFVEPLQRAQKLGIPTPYLETIVSQILAYQRIYNLY